MAGQGFTIKFDKNKALSDLKILLGDLEKEAVLNTKLDFGDNLAKLTQQVSKLGEAFSKIDFSKLNSQVNNTGNVFVDGVKKSEQAVKQYQQILNDLKKTGNVTLIDEKMSTKVADQIDKFTVKVRTSTGEVQRLQYALKNVSETIKDENGESFEKITQNYVLTSKNIINGQQIKQLQDYKNKLIEIREASKELSTISLPTKDSNKLDKTINQLTQYITRLEDGLKIKNLNMDDVGSYVNKTIQKYNDLTIAEKNNIKEHQKAIELKEKQDQESSNMWNKINQDKINGEKKSAQESNKIWQENYNTRVQLYKQLSQLQETEFSKKIQYENTNDESKRLQIEKQILDIRKQQNEIGKTINSYEGYKDKELVNQIISKRNELEKLLGNIISENNRKIQQETESFKHLAEMEIRSIEILAQKKNLSGNEDVINYINKLKESLNSLNTVNLNKVREEFNTTAKETKLRINEMDASQNKWLKSFKNAVSNTILYATGGGLLYGLFDQIREGISFMKELDTAQSNIMMITGRTREQVQGLTKDYVDLAKAMHVDVMDAVSGSEELLRAGYSDEDAKQLLKYSTMASKISGLDAGQTSEYIIAMKNAFDMPVEGINGVAGAVDKLTKLDNESATSLKELMTAMQRTSASAKGVGVDFDHLSAYVATVSDVTRRSASTIGESWKTIFSRFEDVKGGKTFDPDNESISNVERDLNAVGIAIRKDKDTFRDFGTVIEEIADKWKKGQFTDVEQSTILKSMAGTRQREVLKTLLDNWDRYKELLQKEKDSYGNAQEVYERGYGQSTVAKIADLSNSVKELWMTILDSKVINSFVGGITTMITSLTNFIKSTGDAKLGIIGIGLALGGVIKLVSSLFNLFTMGTTLKNIASTLSATTKGVAGLGVATKTAGSSLGLFANVLSKLPALLNPVVLGIAGITASTVIMAREIDRAKFKVTPLKTKNDVQHESFTEDKSNYNKIQNQSTVSVDVQKSMQSYNQLDIAVEESLLKLKANSRKITQETANDLTNTFKKMGAIINSNLDKQYEEEYKTMTTFFANSKSLTETEKNDILQKDKFYYDNKKTLVSQTLEQISAIENKAVTENRELTTEEYNKISELQSGLMIQQIDSITKSSLEQQAIYENLATNHKAISVQEASDVIKESAKQRDETIKNADDQLKKVEANIIYQRDVVHSMTKEQADKAIEEAKKQHDTVVEQAENQHKKVVTEVQSQCTESKDLIDTNTGDIMNIVQRFKLWWDNLVFERKEISIYGGVESKAGVPQKTVDDYNREELKKGKKNDNHRMTGSAEALGGTATKGENLVGEEGTEIVINKDRNKFAVVGHDGAEVINMEGGETVIPHQQTKEILKDKKNVDFGSAYANGTIIKTTETGGIVEGEGFFPNLFGEKPKENKSTNASSTSASKKTTNPYRFDFQSTVDVDKTELDADIRDIDNFEKAIKRLNDTAKVYKDSKHFNEALRLEDERLEKIKNKLNSIKIGYINTTNTKEKIKSEMLNLFGSQFDGKDFESMTKPEFETIYNQMYGRLQTGLSQEQQKTLEQNSKAFKQLTDDWFKAKEQLESLSEKELSTQTEIADAIKDKWQTVFAQQDYTLSKIESTSKTLRDGFDVLSKVTTQDFDEKITLLESIVKIGEHASDIIKQNIQLLNQQRDAYTEGSIEYDILSDRIDSQMELFKQKQLQLIEDNQNLIETAKQKALDLVEKQIYNGQTQEQFEDAKKAKINALQDQLDEMDKQNESLQEQEERQKNLLELTEAQIQLQKEQDNKTKRQLTKDNEGNYQWTYVSDQNTVQDLEKQVKDKIQSNNKWESDIALKHKKEEIEKQKNDLQDEINLRREALDTIKHNLEIALSDQKNLFANGSASINTIINSSLDQLNTIYNGKFNNILSTVRTNVSAVNSELSLLNSEFISAQNGIIDAVNQSLPQTPKNQGKTVWVTDVNSPDGQTAKQYYENLGYNVKQINDKNFYQTNSDDILLGLAGTLYGNQSSAKKITGQDRYETAEKAKKDAETIAQWQKNNIQNTEKYQNTLNKIQSQGYNENTNNLNYSLKQQQGMLFNNGNINTSIVSSGWDSVNSVTGQKLDTMLNTIRDKVQQGSNLLNGLYNNMNNVPSTGGGGISSGGSGGSSSSGGGGGHWGTIGGVIGGIIGGIGHVLGFDTGGYTGQWNDTNGRLAFLHQKELVLDEGDTANILKTVDIQRNMVSMANNMILPNSNNLINRDSKDGISINNLTLSLPNVKDAIGFANAITNDLPSTVLKYSKLNYEL